MAEGSAIEWTDHTFNPWWGCQKVSPGCSHCYAETLAKRFGKGIWGPPHATDRRTFGDKHWRDPIKWNARAARERRRARVFCASMADVFEDHPQVGAERARLWELIEETPHLDWQVLTKRPENVARMVPDPWSSEGWPRNVWLGVSVEDQERANERVPQLLEIPAAVRFLSCEPLLGPVYLAPHWLRPTFPGPRIGWVIVGGESGPGARPMHPQWVRDLLHQSVMVGSPRIPFLFKQWGAWRWAREVSDFDYEQSLPEDARAHYGRQDLVGLTRDGARVSPADPPPYPSGTAWMMRVGKKDAGREIDGRTWGEFPEAVIAHA